MAMTKQRMRKGESNAEVLDGDTSPDNGYEKDLGIKVNWKLIMSKKHQEIYCVLVLKIWVLMTHQYK